MFVPFEQQQVRAQRAHFPGEGIIVTRLEIRGIVHIPQVPLTLNAVDLRQGSWFSMINSPISKENCVDSELMPRDKVRHYNSLGGFCHGTVYALKNHANSTSTRRNSFKLFLGKWTLQRSCHQSILPGIENSLFQNSLPFSYPLLPAERQRGWT